MERKANAKVSSSNTIAKKDIKIEESNKKSSTVSEKIKKETAAVKEKPKTASSATKVASVSDKSTSRKRTTTSVKKATTKKSDDKEKQTSKSKVNVVNKPVEKVKEMAKINYSELLGSSEIKVVIDSSNKKAEQYSIKAVLRNLGYVKDVIVRYTVDGWNTYKEEPLKFKNLDESCNIEEWDGIIKISEKNKDKFQYAVSYQVNGITYWDNNSNKNYEF
ncbi:MAG: hypothetical protein GX275_13720 [Clostridiales bacterium]|nr:hypothetical protein [Clostridiales bacterium]